MLRDLGGSKYRIVLGDLALKRFFLILLLVSSSELFTTCLLASSQSESSSEESESYLRRFLVFLDLALILVNFFSILAMVANSSSV